VIIDTSVIIAILNDEPERRAFNEAIEKSDICLLSTAGFVEASMVMEYSRGYEGLRDFDLWMAAAGIELAPVDTDQAHIATVIQGRGFRKDRYSSGDVESN
jgi:ribonuclease VapC